MSEPAPPPPPPPPLQPSAAGFPPPGEPKSRSGCLKWGLVGCAALSVLLIVGLVFVGYKAKGLLGWALGKIETQVVASCDAEVTDAEKEAFRKAFASFAAGAQKGTTSAERVQGFQKKAMAALGDGTVSPAELKELTAAVSSE